MKNDTLGNIRHPPKTYEKPSAPLHALHVAPDEEEVMSHIRRSASPTALRMHGNRDYYTVVVVRLSALASTEWPYVGRRLGTSLVEAAEQCFGSSWTNRREETNRDDMLYR